MSTEAMRAVPAVPAYPPIRKQIRVAASPERAFHRFTGEMAAWWPLASHSIGQRDAESVAMEPRVGGRIVESIRGGESATWGTVTAWDPPRHVAFSWHPGHAEAEAMDVEVRFTPDGDGTLVELEHRGFERLGKMAKKAYRAYPMGWDYVLGTYGERRGFYQAFLKVLTGTLMFVMRVLGKG
jgi:uncharacterized protein YndB with AHSA1/START domain